MRPRKSTIFVALLALLLAAFAIGMGQGTTQTDQKKKAESCCAEGASCCAEGMSCKEGECCCDSCDMANMKHDAKMKHDPKKHGECCNVKDKGKTKAKKAA